MEVLAGRESEGFPYGAGSDAAMDGDVNVENVTPYTALNLEASRPLLKLPPSASQESIRHIESKLRGGIPPLVCKLCNIVFNNAQALGGHRSNSAEHVERLNKLSPKEKLAYLDEERESAGPKSLLKKTFKQVASKISPNARARPSVKAEVSRKQRCPNLRVTSRISKFYSSKQYLCDLCCMAFDNAPALGGHRSGCKRRFCRQDSSNMMFDFHRQEQQQQKEQLSSSADLQNMPGGSRMIMKRPENEPETSLKVFGGTPRGWSAPSRNRVLMQPLENFNSFRSSMNTAQKDVLETYFQGGKKRSAEEYEAIALQINSLAGGKRVNARNVEVWFTNRRHRPLSQRQQRERDRGGKGVRARRKDEGMQGLHGIAGIAGIAKKRRGIQQRHSRVGERRETQMQCGGWVGGMGMRCDSRGVEEWDSEEEEEDAMEGEGWGGVSRSMRWGRADEEADMQEICFYSEDDLESDEEKELSRERVRVGMSRSEGGGLSRSEGGGRSRSERGRLLAVFESGKSTRFSQTSPILNKTCSAAEDQAPRAPRMEEEARARVKETHTTSVAGRDTRDELCSKFLTRIESASQKDDAECVLEAEESERCGTCTPLLPAVIERATSSRAIDQPRIPEIVQRSQGTEVREVGGDDMRSRRRVWEEEKGGENVEKDICEAGGKDICQAEETVVKDVCQARGSVVRERNEIKDKNAVLQELLARMLQKDNQSKTMKRKTNQTQQTSFDEPTSRRDASVEDEMEILLKNTQTSASRLGRVRDCTRLAEGRTGKERELLKKQQRRAMFSEALRAQANESREPDSCKCVQLRVYVCKSCHGRGTNPAWFAKGKAGEAGGEGARDTCSSCNGCGLMHSSLVVAEQQGHGVVLGQYCDRGSRSADVSDEDQASEGSTEKPQTAPHGKRPADEEDESSERHRWQTEAIKGSWEVFKSLVVKENMLDRDAWRRWAKVNKKVMGDHDWPVEGIHDYWKDNGFPFTTFRKLAKE